LLIELLLLLVVYYEVTHGLCTNGVAENQIPQTILHSLGIHLSYHIDDGTSTERVLLLLRLLLLHRRLWLNVAMKLLLLLLLLLLEVFLLYETLWNRLLPRLRTVVASIAVARIRLLVRLDHG